jgi:hypothetical protein
MKIDEARQNKIASHVDLCSLVKAASRAGSIAASDALYLAVIPYPHFALEGVLLG